MTLPFWSHQSHFWRPGDDFHAKHELTIEIIFDDTAPYDPFVSWPNGSRTEVFDEDGNSSGFFLATPMSISPSTANLALGEHTMTVRVTTPHDEVFEHTWRFVIQERDIPRVDIPPRLLPTAEFLRVSPQPTPAFILRLPTEASYFDRFSGIDSREGICLVLDDTSFVPQDFHEGDFRDPMWEDVIIFVDDIPIDRSQFGDLQPDTPGHWFICVDTDYLAVGVHLAEVTVTADGEEFSYEWVFTIE